MLTSYATIKELSKLPEYNKPVKLGVVGSRFYTDYSQLESYLQFLLGKYDIRYIVSGGKRRDGKGVDTLAEVYADNNQFDKIIFPPKTKRKNGFQAFFDRNEQIANTCTILLAVKDVITGGTADTVERTFKLGKPILWANYQNEIIWYQKLAVDNNLTASMDD